MRINLRAMMVAYIGDGCSHEVIEKRTGSANSQELSLRAPPQSSLITGSKTGALFLGER